MMHTCTSNSTGNMHQLWQHWYPQVILRCHSTQHSIFSRQTHAQNCRCGFEEHVKYDAVVHMEDLPAWVPKWTDQGRLPLRIVQAGWGEGGTEPFFGARLSSAPGRAQDSHNSHAQEAAVGFFR
jgi:hypothetical protein